MIGKLTLPAAVFPLCLAAGIFPAQAYEVVQASQQLALGPYAQATVLARCPSGQSVLSGGYDVTRSTTSLTVTASHPSNNSSVLWSAWLVTVTNFRHGNASPILTVYAICQ